MTINNAPIVEAIFHIVVGRENDLNEATLNDYAKNVTENYSVFTKKEQRLLESNISVQHNEPHNITSSVSNILRGYFLPANDNSKVIQANLTDFSFSKLKPYETWETFYKEANQFWRKYAEITSVNRVKRLGLRYINRIPIPFENQPIEPNEFIRIFPEVPGDLSMLMSGYFMQIVLNKRDRDPAQAIVNQTIGSREIENDSTVLPLIFDIEVFQTVDLDPQDSAIDSIFIDNLRPFKNEIFLNSITDKSRELFK